MADYATAAELKSALGITDTDDDSDIAVVLTAASRALDDFCGRFFFQDSTAREYVAEHSDVLYTDDLVSVTTVSIDNDDDDVAELALAAADWHLEPLNAAANSKPFTRIATTLGGTRAFNRARRVKVEGTFGWPAVPDGIKQATIHQATMLLKSSKEGTLGVAPVAGFDGAGMRISGRLHPSAEFLARPFVRYDPVPI